MSNLIDIQTQIEKLTKQADEIRAREFDKTVQEILAKMDAFGIGFKDLQPKRAGGTVKGGKRVKGLKGPQGVKLSTKKAGATASRKSGIVVAAKYRGPNGESWSGRGLMPRWLSAQIAQGKAKEDFAIKS
jgi:DNA-binding protein H-NS